MVRPGIEPGPSPIPEGRSTAELPNQFVGEPDGAWDDEIVSEIILY